MSYINGYGGYHTGYSPSYTSQSYGSSPVQSNQWGGGGFGQPFGGQQSFLGQPLGNLFNSLSSMLGGGFSVNPYSSQQPNYPGNQGPLIIQTGGGKGGKKGQSNLAVIGGFGGQHGGNQGPLILQTGGGKGGKKGQSNLAVIGGFGGQQGHYNPAIQQQQPLVNFQTGGGKGGKGGKGGNNFGFLGNQGPLILQTGGGKGGKKGQSNVSVIGGFGGQHGYQNPVQQQPHVNFQTGGGKGGKGGKGGNNFGFPGNQGPLVLQTGGGKGGKKGQSNIVVAGGFGGHNVAHPQFPVFQTGGGKGGKGGKGFGNVALPFNQGPLILQTGGGKGGKKGQSQIIIAGGFGNPYQNHGAKW